MIIAMKVITTTIKDWRDGPSTGETESETESQEEIPRPKIKIPTLEEVVSSGRGCGC